MKALILEDVNKHSSNIAVGCARHFKWFGYESAIVRNRTEALSKLESDSFEIVLIHHTDFKDIDVLKEKHPNLIYIGYSGGFDKYDKFEEGTIGGDFTSGMRESYTYVRHFGNSLPVILKDIGSKR